MAHPRSSYMYRSVREGNQVRRTYLGSLGDPVVQTLLESERLAKATREAERRKTEGELKVVETVDACLRLIHSSILRAVRNLRKRWRRSDQTRVRRNTMIETDTTQHEYESIVADAADGDLEALASLRQLLEQNPQLRFVLGDLNNHVQLYLIELASGGAIDVKVSLRQMLDEQRDELLDEGDSLLEKLLIDQILSTMLDAAVCQMGLSQPHAKESITRRWERRLITAQTRHQTAIRSLIEVHQMLDDSENGDST